MTKISKIEGVKAEQAHKLAKEGILTSRDLLEKTGSSQELARLANKTGIEPELVSRWIRLSNLLRLKGVSSRFSSLLETAGIDSVETLADQNAKSLFSLLSAVNSQRDVVRRLPSFSQLEDWIDQARQLSNEEISIVEIEYIDDDARITGFSLDGELPGDIGKPNKP